MGRQICRRHNQAMRCSSPSQPADNSRPASVPSCQRRRQRTATETGYLAIAEEWYQVNADGINAADAYRLPSRFYPLQWGGQRYLLADTQLTALVNRINASQPVESGAMLQAARRKKQPPCRLAASPLPPLSPTVTESCRNPWGDSLCNRHHRCSVAVCFDAIQSQATANTGPRRRSISVRARCSTVCSSTRHWDRIHCESGSRHQTQAG